MTGPRAAPRAAVLDAIDARSTAFMRRIALLAVAGMLALATVTTADVLLRALANAPIFGLIELAELGMAVAVAACLPAGLAERVHLRIEVLLERLGAHAARHLTAIGSLALLALFAVLAWRFAVHAQSLAGRNDITMVLGMPTSPYWFAVATFLALCVPAQGVVASLHLRDAARDAAWPDIRRAACIVASAAILLAGAAVMAGLVEVRIGAPDAKVALAAALFAFMWALILLLVPLGAAMGLAGLVGIAVIVGPLPALHAVATQTASLMSNLNLAVVPLFLMMGSFATAAGMSAEVYGLAHALLGHRRGGLAMATVAGCAGFGAVTGSSVATVATIGRIAMPEMRRRGYSVSLAAGSVAAGGTLGALIPPSAPLVLYAILTESSIGELFIAVLVPGIVTVLFYLAAIRLYAALAPDAAPAVPRAGWRARAAAFGRSWTIFVLFAVVIGGLYSGALTATEAASVGALGAFLLALARGGLRGGAFWRVMGETAAATAMIYLLIIGGAVFAFFVGLTQLPEALTAAFVAWDVAPLAVIFGLLAVYLLLGCVMDPFAIMVITVPIVTPLVLGLGYDIVWWGVIMVVVIEIGVLTPPIGLNVFVVKSVAGDVPLSDVFRGIAPFVAADAVKLVMLVLFPALVLFLPRTMG